MFAYRDLEIRSKARPAEFADLLSSHLPKGWTRAKDIEEEMFSCSGISYYCFTFAGSKTLDTATLFFLERETHDAIYVCNIVPRIKSQLTHEEYNAILDDFTHSVIGRLPDRDDNAGSRLKEQGRS